MKTDEELKQEMDPIYKSIEDRFVSRFTAPGAPKKGTKKYTNEKIEFFAGAMSALVAVLSLRKDLTKNQINAYSMPAFWALAIMTGRSLKCEERI